MPIRRVLVPVDFSPASSLAVNYGIGFARKFRAKLTLLHVVESPSALMYTFPTEVARVEKQRSAQAERMLAALVGPEDQDDLDVRFLVRPGDIERVIAAVSLEEQADIIVMGTHGRGLFGRLLIGSVAQSMLRKAAAPVLTVCHVSRPLEFKRILFGTDLAESSVQGFRFALDLASQMGSSLVVAHVLDKRPLVTYETPEVTAVFDKEGRNALQEARMKFAEFEAEGARRKVRVETVLAEGEAREALIRIADENRVDFMILAVRKKGAFERAFLGSTAEPVIREAHVPVLSIPVSTKSSAEESGENVKESSE